MATLFDFDTLESRLDPNTLTVEELRIYLRGRDLSPSGVKKDLVRLWIENRDLLEDDFYNKPSIFHPHKLISFDGNGRDPASLIGLRIENFSIANQLDGRGSCLLCCINKSGEEEKVEIAGIVPRDDARFEAKSDPKLYDALVEAMPEQDLCGDAQTSIFGCVKGLPLRTLDQGLLITGAAVGKRKWRRTDYRVIGIRCEGMQEMGWLYCEDLDEGRDLPRSELPRFVDVRIL